MAPETADLYIPCPEGAGPCLLENGRQMNKLVVGFAAACALMVGPVAIAAAQADSTPARPHASATATDESQSADPTTKPAESTEPAETDTSEAADPTTAAATTTPKGADHTFTHGLPGAVAASATPGDGFGKYVSGINKTGAPGAVASTMGKGKGHN
jgi:hypothetical protein